jgi:alcohol dehydrogenase (cytochrome c)
VTPAQEAGNAYLGAGVAPAADNWFAPGGDIQNTAFSQLKQINSSNVGSLKLIWDMPIQVKTVNVGTLQQAPICCPDNLMYQIVTAGMVAINPGDGTVAWEYKGTAYDTVRGATTTHTAARGISYSPKTDYIYAGQNDGSVVAIKAKTGAPAWRRRSRVPAPTARRPVPSRSPSRTGTTTGPTGSSSRLRTAASRRSAVISTPTTRRPVR